MSGLQDLYKGDHKPGSDSNFGVDFVIHYEFPANEKTEAEAAFTQLIEGLASAGLATEVRPGDKSSVLVFIKIASERLLRYQVYRYRLQDWLYGVRTSPPNKDLDQCFAEEPIFEAEKLRLAYLLITNSKNEGGAGINPKVGQWKYVSSIFPLHDHAFNRTWLKEWSTKYMLDENDLNSIRDKFGAQVGFYFAFLQNYTKFLLFPAAFGFATWLLLGQFSWLYSIVNCLWCVIFVEHWKKKEVDLAVQWGTRGVSRVQRPRAEFQFEAEAEDPVTGELVKMYPPMKRLQRQLLQVPFAIACMIVLGSLIASCFAIEIFISEIYNGPFKQYLTFLPTILLTVFMPILSTILTGLAEQLTNFENYETHDAHQAALVQKIFVLNFITAYLPVFLTAFVYVPFGNILVPYLDIFHVTAQKFSSNGKVKVQDFKVNPDRLTKQVVYFTVTAQVINFLLEVVVPYAKRKVFKAVDEKLAHEGYAHPTDAPEEASFLSRARNEAGLDKYDVTVDYREMVQQFGYLSLFSVVWPLTACSFLVNNWIEARSDAVKIAIGCQRPTPWRADSIGPWLTSLGFLSWLGSLTTSALIYLFSKDPHGSPAGIRGWALLLSILFSEHIYLVVQLIVRYVLDKVDSPGLQRERAERFAMRKRLLAETLGEAEADKADGLNVQGAEKITRDTLEEEAREASRRGHGSAEELFWLHQRGASESIQIGRRLISQVDASHNKTGKQ